MHGISFSLLLLRYYRHLVGVVKVLCDSEEDTGGESIPSSDQGTEAAHR